MPTTPTTRALSVLQPLVARYVMLPTDTEVNNNATDALNAGIAYLNAHTWEWTNNTSTITLTADTVNYTIIDAFKKERSALLLNTAGTVERELTFEDRQVLDHRFVDRTQSGTPEFYTVSTVPVAQLTLYPPASASFITQFPNLLFRHYQRVQLYVNATDTLNGPFEVEEFLIWYARSELASIYNPDKRVYADTRWRDMFRRLERDNRKRMDYNIGKSVNRGMGLLG